VIIQLLIEIYEKLLQESIKQKKIFLEFLHEFIQVPTCCSKYCIDLWGITAVQVVLCHAEFLL